MLMDELRHIGPVLKYEHPCFMAKLSNIVEGTLPKRSNDQQIAFLA